MNLEILNYLLSLFGLATVSELPANGELGAQRFNFNWRLSPPEIQILILKSYLLHPKDLVVAETSGGFSHEYKRPFCFLIYEVEKDKTVKDVKAAIPGLRQAAEKIELRIIKQVSENLTALKNQLAIQGIGFLTCWEQESKNAAAHETKVRLTHLKSAMSKEFTESCDKWNIPNSVSVPKDSLTKCYQEFLSHDPTGAAVLYKMWHSEFVSENKYP